MVFSTLHTNNAPATLSRMLNMGVAPFNIASSVSLIMAQRLLRRLCSNCKEPMERPPEHALKKAGFSDEDLAQDWTMYRAVGCDTCRGKGYKGRAGVYEVMPITDEMQRGNYGRRDRSRYSKNGISRGNGRFTPSRFIEGNERHYFVRGSIS